MSLIFLRFGIIFLFVCLSLTSCIDFRGATQPYSYVPAKVHTEWTPKQKIKRLTPTQLIEDYTYLTESGPLSLGEVIDLALLKNPGTGITWAMAREAAAKYGQSMKNDYIITNAGATIDRSRNAEFTSTRRTIIYETDWSPSINFSYLILDFGQTRASSRSALQSLYNANYTHNRTIQTVIQSSMNSYYSYLSQEEQLRAANADVEDAQSTLDAVNERFRTGLADIGDQIQAKTSLLQAQLYVVTQKQKLVAAYSQLAVDLGIPAYVKVELQTYPDEIRTFEVASVYRLIEDAIKLRPDILAIEADVHSKEQALLAAKRNRFPKLKSTFDWGRTYYDFNGTRFNDGQDWEWTLSLNFPLFHGFFLANAVKVARADLQQSKAEYQKYQLAAAYEVVNYQSDVKLAKEALRYSKEFLEAAEEDFLIYLKKYKVGTATILDVINAQTSVSNARSKFVDSEKNWYISVANLAYSTGLLTLPNTHTLPEILTKDKCSYD